MPLPGPRVRVRVCVCGGWLGARRGGALRAGEAEADMMMFALQVRNWLLLSLLQDRECRAVVVLQKSLRGYDGRDL